MASRTHHSDSSAASSLTAAVALVVIILGGLGYAGYYFLHAGQATSSSPTVTPSQPAAPTTPTNPYAVLSPATVPSKTPECNQPISFAANGNSGPVQCANGDLNVLEWNALSALEPTVLTLGYSATPSQIQAALCSDANASNADANTRNSNVIEGTVYQIAALYYGWNFSPSPSVILTDGGCG